MSAYISRQFHYFNCKWTWFHIFQSTMHGVFIFSSCVCVCFYWMAYSISMGSDFTGIQVRCEFHSQHQQFVTNNVIIKYILPTKVFVYLNHSTWNHYSPRKRAVLRKVVSFPVWMNVLFERKSGSDEGESKTIFLCDLHWTCVWAQNMFLFEMSTFKKKTTDYSVKLKIVACAMFIECTWYKYRVRTMLVCWYFKYGSLNYK